MITVVNGLIFEGGKVLVVDKKGKLILPGGKLDSGETRFNCLKREFRDELSGTKIEILDYYNSFSGMTPFSKRYFETDVYHCKLVGDLGKASAEISDWKYVGKDDLGSEHLSEVTKKILENLVKDGYLK